MKTSSSENYRRKPVIYTIVLIAVALGLTVWQTWNVAEGIEGLRLYGDRPFWLLLIFAGMLHGTVNLAFLLMPVIMGRILGRHWLSTSWRCTKGIAAVAVAVVVSAGVIFFEAAHSVLIQIYNSMGADMVSTHRKELEGINTRISEASAALAGGFRTRLSAIDDLAGRSERGMDESGLKSCGPICRSLRLKFGTLSQEFSDVALPIAPARADAADLRALFTEVRHRLDSLKAQTARYGQFLAHASGGQMPANIQTSLTQLEAAAAQKAATYSGVEEINQRSLAMATLWSMLKGAWNGNYDAFKPVYMAAIAYGVVVFAALLLISIMSWRLEAWNTVAEKAETLVDAAEEEEKKAEALEKLGAAKRRSFKAWLQTELWGRRPKSPGSLGTGGLGGGRAPGEPLPASRKPYADGG